MFDRRNIVQTIQFWYLSEKKMLQFFAPMLVYDVAIPIGSMGLAYLPSWMVDFEGKLVGKYTSHMDPMGYEMG